MELIFNSLWIVGFVIAIFIIKFVIRKSQSIKAKQDLECHAAENWVDEIEEKERERLVN